MTQLKFCDYSCAHSQVNKDVPLCLTLNPIYCEKYGITLSKGSVCLDNKNIEIKVKR